MERTTNKICAGAAWRSAGDSMSTDTLVRPTLVHGSSIAKKVTMSNQAVLDQQIAADKTFIFTVDPRTVNETSFTRLEYGYLLTKGCRISTDNGGIFDVVKK